MGLILLSILATSSDEEPQPTDILTAAHRGWAGEVVGGEEGSRQHPLEGLDLLINETAMNGSEDVQEMTPGGKCCRDHRPAKIAIILRGLPGSGKTHIAKKLRDVEVENGGDAPRIHALDDYFVTVHPHPAACL